MPTTRPACVRVVLQVSRVSFQCSRVPPSAGPRSCPARGTVLQCRSRPLDRRWQSTKTGHVTRTLGPQTATGGPRHGRATGGPRAGHLLRCNRRAPLNSRSTIHCATTAPHSMVAPLYHYTLRHCRSQRSTNTQRHCRPIALYVFYSQCSGLFSYTRSCFERGKSKSDVSQNDR